MDYVKYLIDQGFPELESWLDDLMRERDMAEDTKPMDQADEALWSLDNGG
jgi:hypothetical protein